MASSCICDESRPAQDMRMLRHAVKVARPGTGEIGRAIESCTFDITERGFTMLIGTCQRSGRCRKAMEIFDAMTGPKMAAKGIKPNFYTYSSLISVCCSAGACAKGLQIFQAMREAEKLHGTPEADVEVFKRLLMACYKDGRMSDVRQLYQTLLENSLPADAEMEVCVMEAHAELGEWEDAICMMDQLHADGVEIPARSYSRFLAACASYENLSMGVEIFLSMQMMGVEPSPADCHQVICAAAAMKDVGTCLQLVEEMQTAAIDISPATYACLSPLLSQGHVQKWEQICGTMAGCRKGVPIGHIQKSHGLNNWGLSRAQVGRA